MCLCVFFFFKQKTAYEMRISDWSSDVCSSDLTAKEKPMQGKVLAAGPGARGDDGKLVALDVKKGDKVLYGKWSGTEVKLDGKTMLIMRESDIMGVLQ